jgi:hypothetical protein
LHRSWELPAWLEHTCMTSPTICLACESEFWTNAVTNESSSVSRAPMLFVRPLGCKLSPTNWSGRNGGAVYLPEVLFLGSISQLTADPACE